MRNEEKTTGSKFLRGQLFAKEKYFHKPIIEPKV